MTGQELAALGLALFGAGWRRAMASALAVDERTVRRWLAGTAPVPPGVETEIRRMCGAAAAAEAAWPRDEWILGDGPPGETGRREYLVHTRPPRFIARVVETDDDGEPVDGGPLDPISGVCFQASPGDLLCEVVWIDAPPGPADLLRLLEAAADALQAHAPG